MAANDVWTCCSCKSPNLDANANVKCPVCSHTKCSNCLRGRQGLASAAGNTYELSNLVPNPCFPSVTPRYSPLSENMMSFYEGNTHEECRPRAHHDCFSLSTFGQPSSRTKNSTTPSIKVLEVFEVSSFIYSGTATGSYVCPKKPSTAGWWVCHSCQWTNDPALYPRTCSNCWHTRCSACTTLSR